MNENYIWTKDEIHDARNVDLVVYFRSQGYTLEKNNNHYYVKEISGLILISMKH